MGGYLSSIFSLFSRELSKPPPQPIKGPWPRLKNILLYHFRGIFGILIPLIICLALWGEKDKFHQTVQAVWIMMFWFLLLHPVNVPVVGFLPVFMFPLTGVLTTDDVTNCYFNQNIAFMIIGGMLSMAMNNSGLDKRIALFILTRKKLTGKMLLYKASLAAFLLSIVCHRLLTCVTIYSIFENIPGPMTTDSDYLKTRNIINNAIQTSSIFGSIVMVHTSFTTMAFKALYSELGPRDDIFNYLQLAAFTLPVAIILLVLNTIYYSLLLNRKSEPGMNDMEEAINYQRRDLPPMSGHEKFSGIFTFAAILLFFLLYSEWLGYLYTPSGVNDVTIAAIFVFILSMLPKELFFFKYITAKGKSDLPPRRPTSSLLFWKFIDQNTNYGYMFLIGAGVVLFRAITKRELNVRVRQNIEPLFDTDWYVASLQVVLLAGLLPNMISSVGACILFLPMILCFGTTSTWSDKLHLGALGVGIASCFGFMHPFRHTPAFYCHYNGKTPIKDMRRLAIGSVVISIIVMWLALCFYAPVVWPSEAPFYGPPVNISQLPPPPAPSR